MQKHGLALDSGEFIPAEGKDMKDNTQPEALRLAEILEGDYCPDWFYEQGVDEVSAELRRLHAYCQELESQVIRDCMTHVQNPAEIEHVAGCTRSHPHENMDSACRAKAAIAEMQNMAARGAEATAHDLERFVSMLTAAPVEAQKPAAHVQNPAENEHVAGDVSKNRAELDMTQQPAPTPQADSQPAPVVDRDRIREIFMAHGFVTKEGQTDLKQYVYDAADALLRAARAPADSVTAPAGGVVAYLDIGAGGYLDLEAALSDEAMQQLPKGRHALVIAGTYGIAGYVAALQPAPATQQAGYLAGLLKEVLADACYCESETNLSADLYQRLYAAHAALTAAPQPAPTAQAADSVPAVDGDEHPAARRMREDFEREYGRHHLIASAIRKYYNTRKNYDDAWNRDRETPVTLDDVLEAEREVFRAAARAARAPAESVPALDRDRIREIFMAHGFTVKEGQTDLKQYVYDAADALLRAARAPADSVLEDAARYRWLEDYLVGDRTDLDDEIVACKSVYDLSKVVDAARKQGANHDR